MLGKAGTLPCSLTVVPVQRLLAPDKVSWASHSLGCSWQAPDLLIPKRQDVALQPARSSPLLAPRPSTFQDPSSTEGLGPCPSVGNESRRDGA